MYDPRYISCLSKSRLGEFYFILKILFLYSKMIVDKCSHTASIAAGNHGIPVVVTGHHFGNASGMAPRAQ